MPRSQGFETAPNIGFLLSRGLAPKLLKRRLLFPPQLTEQRRAPGGAGFLHGDKKAVREGVTQQRLVAAAGKPAREPQPETRGTELGGVRTAQRRQGHAPSAGKTGPIFR